MNLFIYYQVKKKQKNLRIIWVHLILLGKMQVTNPKSGHIFYLDLVIQCIQPSCHSKKKLKLYLSFDELNN